jgi:ribosome-associated translation inhibitor RaiA
MNEALAIVFDNLDPSPALAATIQEKSKKLDRFFPHVTDARVIISRPQKRHHKGDLYHVSIEVNVPGKRLCVSKTQGKEIRHEQLPAALNDAFAAMARQLEDYCRRLRGDVKHHESPAD